MAAEERAREGEGPLRRLPVKELLLFVEREVSSERVRATSLWPLPDDLLLGCIIKREKSQSPIRYNRNFIG